MKMEIGVRDGVSPSLAIDETNFAAPNRSAVC